MAEDEEGNNYACIRPLNTYIQSNSGFLGYIAYSCSGNGSLLVDDEMQLVLKTLTADSTTTRPHTKTHSKTTISTRTKGANILMGTGGTGIPIGTGTAHIPMGTDGAGGPGDTNRTGIYLTADMRRGLPPRPTTFKRGTLP